MLMKKLLFWLCAAGMLLICGCRAIELSQVNTMGGIWMETAMRGGRLTVVAIQENTPAYLAGLRAGDIITFIDGRPTARMTVGDASLRLCGEAGTAVRLKIFRSSTQEIKEYTLIREDLATLKERGKASPGELPVNPVKTPAAFSLPTETVAPF
jgi:C-terminal processing protease CtpA/Prc